MYNSYEEYMQSMLGYNMPNTYSDSTNFYYNQAQMNRNLQEINGYYPEIYGIIYPVIQRVCSRGNFSNITSEMINKMTEDVYNIIEGSKSEETEQNETLKNGDVRNPRASREVPRQVEQKNNYMLKDLIKILIIREILSGINRYGNSTNTNIGMGGMPGIMRPR